MEEPWQRLSVVFCGRKGFVTKIVPIIWYSWVPVPQGHLRPGVGQSWNLREPAYVSATLIEMLT